MKLVTFVPMKHVNQVRDALFGAGCGCIGNYDACSYNIEGIGTFRAGNGTHPYCGKIGELHHEEEMRIETILPVYKRDVVTKLYWQPILMKNRHLIFIRCKTNGIEAGAGIIGVLEEPETEGDFLRRVKQIF